MLNLSVSFCVLFCRRFAKWKTRLLLSLLMAIPSAGHAASEKPVDPNSVMILFSGHEQIPFQQELFQGFIEEQYRLLFNHPELFSKEIHIQRLDAYRNDEGYLNSKINDIFKNYSEFPGTIIAEGNFALQVAQGLSIKHPNEINLMTLNSNMSSLPGYSKAELFDLETTLNSIPSLFPNIEELVIKLAGS